MEHIVDFFISNAHADTLAGGAQGGNFSFVIMLVVFSLFIYFAMWRPQSKRAKEQKTLLDSLTKGDEVLTTGGLLGRITKVSGHYISLTIANNVDVHLQKSSVVSVMPKGTLKSIE